MESQHPSEEDQRSDINLDQLKLDIMTLWVSRIEEFLYLKLSMAERLKVVLEYGGNTTQC